MTEVQGINLAGIAEQRRVDQMSIRLAAVQFAVQGRRENDGPLIGVIEDVYGFLSGND